ncbi:MAG: polysaccharide biosynthesis protein [Marmoricola sp.]
MTTTVRECAVGTLPTLLIGGGKAGRALGRDLARVPSFGLEPIGFLDDDVRLAAKAPANRPWLGTLAELEEIIERTGVQVVVIAIPSLEHETLQDIALRATRMGVSVRHLPPFLSALQREIVGTDMRSLQVGSLIGRAEMHVVSREVSSVLTGKRVLVTGAGGSIGSELCRQVNGFAPESLVLLDHDESNLHRLQLEVWGQGLLDSESVVVADIRDAERIHQIFRDHQPEVVFHAAALKHLPVLERHPCEGVKSNVQGTENLVQAALAYNVERFILISTDKAANPASVLGATKRLAELVLTSYRGTGTTALACVRFGNVLGSRGSLLHVIREQLASGVGVTVTHPDVTRFFMTIEEAVGLVLEAARMAERSGTFVLDMGDPVRIVDVVRNFASLVNAPTVPIRFTGLRPGEKLHEELFGSDETALPTEHPRISQAPGAALPARFRAQLRDLYDAAAHNRPDEVVAHLRSLVPEYAPTPRLVAEGAVELDPSALPAMAALYPDDY